MTAKNGGATSEKRRIKLYDIHPGANPRKDFGDLEGLAEAIRATGGSPINPIVVVEDGTYDGEPQYRLVDGERRWKAMQLLHRTADWETDAIVFQSYQEADEAIAMVATDEKKTLTAGEIARGFQQMLRLDVDETRMAGALHRTADEIRRARRVASATAVQATLDQYIAAAEFEDERDRSRILEAEPGEVEYVVSSIRREAEARERLAAIVEVADGYGIAVVDERPDGYVSEREIHVVEDLARELERLGVTAVEGGEHAGDLCLQERTVYGGRVGWFTLCRKAPEPTEEDIAARREREAQAERDARMEAARTSFVNALLRDVAIYGSKSYAALKALAGRSRSGNTWVDDRIRDEISGSTKDGELARRVWKVVASSPASDYELLHWVYGLASAAPGAVRDAMEIAASGGYALVGDDEWFIEQVDAMEREEHACDDEGGRDA